MKLWFTIVLCNFFWLFLANLTRWHNLKWPKTGSFGFVLALYSISTVNSMSLVDPDSQRLHIIKSGWVNKKIGHVYQLKADTQALLLALELGQKRFRIYGSSKFFTHKNVQKYGSHKKKIIVNSVLNLSRVTHFLLCLLGTQVWSARVLKHTIGQLLVNNVLEEKKWSGGVIEDYVGQ